MDNFINNNIEKVIIVLPLILGLSVGYFSKSDKWYYNLKKDIDIPGYIFGIVWPILYIFIGIAYYLALNGKSSDYWIFPIIHLMLNLSYTPLLFTYHKLLLSTIVTTLILITAIYMAYLFYYYDKTGYAYKLLIPYILWLIFANYLAWSLYSLNQS